MMSILPPCPSIWLVFANERVSKSAPEALPELDEASPSDVMGRGVVMGRKLGVVCPNCGKLGALRPDVRAGMAHFSS